MCPSVKVVCLAAGVAVYEVYEIYDQRSTCGGEFEMVPSVDRVLHLEPRNLARLAPRAQIVRVCYVLQQSVLA